MEMKGKLWIIILVAVLLMCYGVYNSDDEDRDTEVATTEAVKSQVAESTEMPSTDLSEFKGTYMGDDGSGFVLFKDGKADYLWIGWDTTDEDCVWSYDDDVISVNIPSLKCDVYAEVPSDGLSYVFKSDSDNWNEEVFVKTSSDSDKISAEKFKALYTEIMVDEDAEYEKMDELVKGQPYTTVRDLLKDMDYEAQYEHENTHLDFTGELTAYTDDELNSMGFMVTGIKEMDYSSKTITLYVNTAENAARIEKQAALKETLEKNFNASYALSAMELYGKELYPNGFTIHKVTGMLAETPVDENTWFMKYTCKVTDISGKKKEMTCEAKIKGPESNPTVYDFNVYR
jgi:hypothetical protein